MVQTTVRPVLTVLRTARITIEAARASSPDVGSLRGVGRSCLEPQLGTAVQVQRA